MLQTIARTHQRRKPVLLAAAFALVVISTVVVVGDQEAAEAQAAAPTACPAGTTMWFEQAQQGNGRPSGPPGGTDPGAIDLQYLGGHPNALYIWALADSSLEVTRLVLEAANTTEIDDNPGGSGKFVTAPNARRVIFCLGEVPGPAIRLSKGTIEIPDGDDNGVGDTPVTGPTTVTYLLTVANIGNVPLTGVTVEDPRLPPLSCNIPTVLTTTGPDSVGACTASRTISQADLDGSANLFNEATVTATYQGQTVSDSDTFLILFERTPSLTLTKTANPATISAPGDIDYTLTVENTGNVTVTDVKVSDFTVDATDCLSIPTSLAPGATATCTATTAVDQATIDAGGTIVNTARAGGVFDGRPVLDQASATVTIDQSPAITIEKTSTNFPPGADPGKADPGIDDPDEDILYDITVRNTGNVTVTGVSVIDTDADVLACGALPGTLAPGASGTCTAVLDVDQTRFDAGGDIINTATVNATGAGQNLAASDSYDVPIVQNPSLNLDKDSSSNPDVDGDNVANTPVTTPGDVDYTYTVTNDGNVTVAGIGIGDTVTTGAATEALPVTCDDTALAPGSSTTCEATYLVTQADINAGAPVTNTATVTGTSVSGADVFDTAGFTVPVTNDPILGVSKVSTNYPDTSTPTNGVADTPLVGPDTIAYEITVTNAGNVSVTDVVIADPALSDLACTWPGADGELAVGESVDCAGTTAVDQSEFDTNPLGATVNVVVATGLTQAGDNVGGADFFVVPFDRQPSLALTKASTSNPDTDGDGVADTPLAGPGTIDYELVLENTGNTTLEAPAVIDVTLDSLTCDSATTVAPGASYICTGSFTVDQASFDDGVPFLGVGGDVPLVANLALATARPPLPFVGDPLLDGDFFIVPFDQRPGIEIDKTSTSNPDTDGDGIADTPVDAPGTIDYSMTVRNTGNVTLTGVSVSDPDARGLSCDATTLAPGASTTCTATGTVTQADIDAGGDILNTATVTATGAGATVTDSDTYDVPVEQQLGATLVKTSTSNPDNDADGIADTPIDAPGPVAYEIVGTNTGNVSFTGVTVVDPTIPDLDCSFPGADGVVPPGGSVTCTGILDVDQALIDAGGDVINTVTATGDAVGQTFETTAAYDIPIDQDPSMSVTKTPAEQSFAIGSTETVTWLIEIVNDGNVTLDDVRVEDFLVEDSEAAEPTPVPACGATIATLGPGESLMVPCSVDRDITEAEFANLVQVTGQTSNAGPVGAASSAIVRSTSDLPETGSESGSLFVVAIALLGVGTALLAVTGRYGSRRRAGPGVTTPPG